MTDDHDLSAGSRAIARPGADKSAEEVGSRVEAAVARVHAHHHPEDGNAGVVRGRPARGAVLAAVLTAAVTVAGVVLLALAVGGKH